MGRQPFTFRKLLVFSYALMVGASGARAAGARCASLARVAPVAVNHDGWLVDEDGVLHPPNWKRHVGKPAVPVMPEEIPPFLAHGIRRDPEFLFQPGDGLDAVFNPTAWREVDQQGREIIPIIVRGEKNRNDAQWKRHSLPYLAIYRPDRPGRKPALGPEPILKVEGPYEEAGGMEDFRFVDLSLQPARWKGEDGKVRTYSKMLTYTAFDGKTARIAGVLFNSHTDFASGKAVKIPTLFDPSLPWNKSAAVVQFRQGGRVRTIAYWNEGNEQHGGVWANEVSTDFTRGGTPWHYPADPAAKPVIQARPGLYDQNLVEPAFQPIVAPLPAELRASLAKQGRYESHGIYVAIHGDSPGVGYQLGYRIFSLEEPTGRPVYESEGTFFRPEHPVEKTKGQVAGVVFMPAMVVLDDGSVHFFWGAGDSMVGHGTSRLARPTNRTRDRR